MLQVQFVMQCLKISSVFGLTFIMQTSTKMCNKHGSFWLPMYDVNVDNCCGAFCIFSLSAVSTILTLKIFESSLILLGWIFVDQASEDGDEFDHCTTFLL